MHWGNYGCGMGYGWGLGCGWLIMAIFWILIILGIASLVKLLASSGRKKPSEESPLDILKKRYAKGEVTREEFQKMKDDLKSD